MKVNNKGLSVVELIVSFVLCILVFIFIIQVVSSIEELYINLGIKTELLNKQSLISEELNNKFEANKTMLIKNCGEDCLVFFYKDNTSEKMQLDRTQNNFIFGEDVYNFNGLGFVDSLSVTVNDDHAYNHGILTISLNIKNSIFDNGKYVIKALYQYGNNETIYSPTNSNKAEIFLFGPAVSYKFTEDLFVEPGWIVYYPSGRITINSTDVHASKMDFDKDGNGFIKYTGVNEAAGVEKTRTIKNYETAKAKILSLYEKGNAGVYYYNGTGRYVYKGDNPNNYLTIGSTMFRILGLEIQSKYVLDENNQVVVVNGEKQKENKYLLKVVSNDYLEENGSNLIKYGLPVALGMPLWNNSIWSREICTGDNCTIERQHINILVNDVYLQGLLNTGTGRLQIQNATFYYGVVCYELGNCGNRTKEYKPLTDATLVGDYDAKEINDFETADITWGDGSIDIGRWSGDCSEDVCEPNAGILSLTDALFASSNADCQDTIKVRGGVPCLLNNWLFPDSKTERFMTRNSASNNWTRSEANLFGGLSVTIDERSRATLYLDADLYIMGIGTSESPYVLYSIKQ